MDWVVLLGGEGSDLLDGGSGADTMSGGAGNDFYRVDQSGDVVIEEIDAGTDTVESTLAYTLLDEFENLSLLGTASINGTGNAANNELRGNDGNNVLDGLEGSDTLYGGAGNDTFYLDGSDTAYENAAEGSDTVYAKANFLADNPFASLVLTANVENGVALGTDNVNLIGNEGNNVLTGNSGSNQIDGREGADTMIGGLGDDFYYVSDAGDVVVEAAGEGFDGISANTSYSLGSNIEVLSLSYDSPSAIAGTGNSLNNEIYGNDLDNILDGGSGADYMEGGGGNDTYVVDNLGDQIAEDVGADTVRSSVTWTLASDLENLVLTGAAAINGTGNGLANQLTGNAANNALSGGNGNDTLDGGAGNDSLSGGSGNDTYIVDSTSDTVTESSSQGTDTVRSSVTWTLGSNVEHLVLTGNSDINGIGNSVANNIAGNSGNNLLDGGSGADALSGGAGNDTYVVDSSSDAVTEAANEGTDLVQSSVTYTIGTNIENLTLTGSNAVSGTGNALDNVLTGNSALNTLTGGAGNDTLDGGASNDVLIGGQGNDTYLVDSSSDTITENSSEGTDTVRSSANFTLSSNVENLTLLGTGAISGTGNALANMITGNSGINTLDGGAGADTLIGGAGNDIYAVDNASDVVTENVNEGIDLVQASVTYTLGAEVENLTLTGTSTINGTGNSLDNVLTGNSANNTLTGGAGNDTLNGGTGSDTMLGGLGNDTYTVDNTGDVVTENASEGTDLVQSSVTYTVGSNIENLTLTGTTAINGTGNALDNTLVGNSVNNTLTGGAGNDTLNGGTGSDTMVGGSGNDTYTVDATGDVVTEAASEGTDLVQSSVTFTIGSNVENLTLSGTSTINGTGNTLDNILIGNSANNTLTGGTGNDTLIGGAGTDTLVGGAGNDTYDVDVSTDVTTENANEGIDLVNSAVTRTLASNIELLFLTGTAANNGTGNTLSNLLRGNTGNNTLAGGGGIDMIEGGAGNDILSNASGNTLLNGGAGTDTLTGTSSNDLLIGGTGNDALTTGSGADIIAFNKGDGQDTVAVSTTKDNTLSIGGGTQYADLLFQKSGNDLILRVGASDQITFTGYYSSTSNRSVNKLQVVLEGSLDYNAGSSNALYNKKIETFNFDGLVSAFDAARAANPSLTTWALGGSLAAQALGGSDTAAMGGDLAYRYGRFGNLSDLSFTPAAGILGSSSFGTSAQTLQAIGSLQDTTQRLS